MSACFKNKCVNILSFVAVLVLTGMIAGQEQQDVNRKIDRNELRRALQLWQEKTKNITVKSTSDFFVVKYDDKEKVQSKKHLLRFDCELRRKGGDFYIFVKRHAMSQLSEFIWQTTIHAESGMARQLRGTKDEQLIEITNIKDVDFPYNRYLLWFDEPAPCLHPVLDFLRKCQNVKSAKSKPGQDIVMMKLLNTSRPSKREPYETIDTRIVSASITKGLLPMKILRRTEKKKVGTSVFWWFEHKIDVQDVEKKHDIWFPTRFTERRRNQGSEEKRTYDLRETAVHEITVGNVTESMIQPVFPDDVKVFDNRNPQEPLKVAAESD